MLVARITGCAPARLTDSGTCLSHSWTFETVEDLKGSNAMVRTLPSDEEPVVNTCDLAPKVGATYLLFMHDGRTSRCSGTHELEAGQADQVVETLRAHRDGATNRITDPWHFTDNGSVCTIIHQIEGATLQINHRYAAPSGAMQPGKDAPSTPSTNLTLVAPQQFEFVGPVLLEVNGRSMPLTSHTVSLPRAAGPLSIAGVSGDAALALFDMLSIPVEVIVSGRRITPGGSQEAYRAVTHTRWLHEAAAQFGVCAARSAPSSER